MYVVLALKHRFHAPGTLIYFMALVVTTLETLGSMIALVMCCSYLHMFHDFTGWPHSAVLFLRTPRPISRC